MKNKKKIKLKANTLTHAQADAITHTHELEIRWKKQPQNEQCVRRMWSWSPTWHSGFKISFYMYNYVYKY